VDGDTVVTQSPEHRPRHLGDGLHRRQSAGRLRGSGFGAEFALARTEWTARRRRSRCSTGAWGRSGGQPRRRSDLLVARLLAFDNPHSYTYADLNGHTTDVTRFAEIAASKGILVVTAVGNEGNSSWHYLIAPSDVHTDSVSPWAPWTERRCGIVLVVRSSAAAVQADLARACPRYAGLQQQPRRLHDVERSRSPHRCSRPRDLPLQARPPGPGSTSRGRCARRLSAPSIPTTASAGASRWPGGAARDPGVAGHPAFSRGSHCSCWAPPAARGEALRVQFGSQRQHGFDRRPRARARRPGTAASACCTRGSLDCDETWPWLGRAQRRRNRRAARPVRHRARVRGHRQGARVVVLP